MTESSVTRSIMLWLRSLPECQAVRVHGGRYAVNQPDVIGCVRGRCFCIEAKRPGGTSRPGQLSMQRKWARAGAVVVRDATCVADVRTAFESEHLL